MSGLYLHIPFCRQACHYCNFHFVTSLDYEDRMVDALCKEIRIRSHEIESGVNTIYFGGGTPSVLSEKNINKLFSQIFSEFTVEDNVEVTIEVNPDDLTSEYLSLLKSTPINRLSIGVQSFHDNDLTYMNRIHSSKEALSSLKRSVDFGFSNISVDLIYGTPGLTIDGWKNNIKTIIDLKIPHISCYQLTVEPQTPLAAFIDRGKLPPPMDEVAVNQFLILIETLNNAGFEHYEISNFAIPGHRSKHNSSYWSREPYIGIGPSAHSYFPGVRSWNTVVNQRYMEQIENGILPSSHEILTIDQQYNEFIMTRLRTMEGVNKFELEMLFPDHVSHFNLELKSNIQSDHYKEIENKIQLTDEGKIWADRISSELMIG